jgi:hypothetical protein
MSFFTGVPLRYTVTDGERVYSNMCISVLTWLLVECVLAPFIPLRTRETRLDPRDLLKIRPEHLVKHFFA